MQPIGGIADKYANNDKVEGVIYGAGLNQPNSIINRGLISSKPAMIVGQAWQPDWSVGGFNLGPRDSRWRHV